MIRPLVLLAAAAFPLAAQQASSHAGHHDMAAVSAVKARWQASHDNVLRAAEAIPESEFGFRPVAGVRSIGELVGHVAGAQMAFCGAVSGEKPAAMGNPSTKAALIQAMKDAGTFCQKAYSITDGASTQNISIFGMSMTGLGALIMNATHNSEHYGNLVTYMRIRGLTPPTSMGQ